MPTTPSYSVLRCLAASLILVLALFAPWAALAVQTVDKGEDLAGLIATLENDGGREQLVSQLKALQAARQVAKPPTEVHLIDQLAAKAGDLKVDLLTLAILAAAVLAAKGLGRAVNRALAAGAPESRANHYLPLLHRSLKTLIGAVALLALAQVWGLDPLSLLDSELGAAVASSLVHMAVVLVAALVGWHILHGAIERYLSATDGDGNPLQRSGRARTLLPLARNAVFVLLVVMVGLILLSEMGVNIAPLLAGAGVLGIAVGFGSQKLVQDIITGVFILLEDTIAVGDSVKLGDHAGTVEAISIRAIRLRDTNGALHTVPFSAVTTVVNSAKGFNIAVMDVSVAPGQDTDRVAQLMAEVGEELRLDPRWASSMAAAFEVQGLERFDPSGPVMRAVVKTAPGDRSALIREFNRRIKIRFEVEGIAMHAPHKVVVVSSADSKP